MDRIRGNIDKDYERTEEEDEFHDTSITSEWLEYYERRNSANIESFEEMNGINYNDSRLESNLIIIDQNNSNQRRESVNEITNF